MLHYFPGGRICCSRADTASADRERQHDPAEGFKGKPKGMGIAEGKNRDGVQEQKIQNRGR